MGNPQEDTPAFLGSTLLANEERLESLTPPPVSCGHRDIDIETLDGGFRYGEVTSIAGVSGTGKTTLAFQAIASHLIQHEKGEVALIATTDPPLARLRDTLISRLARGDQGSAFEEPGYVYKKQPDVRRPDQDTIECVSMMLERVRISRAFDFPGVAEALSEFSASLEEKDPRNGDQADRDQTRRAQSIADSEDEHFEDLLADFEPEKAESANSTEDRTSTLISPPASMVVIDNIANVIGSMMTKSQVQGIACRQIQVG
ncbi:MAG: hypothetical protein LQ338_005613 [Usnochroma carphineum]|nr:MAG: hypothetical protein LQ338_005613 [Usnochroma carphineum]